MSLRLSGDNVGYGCLTHGYGVFLSNCEECAALSHLCRIYGVTPEELGKAIKQVENDKLPEEKLDNTSGFWYNGF